MDRVLGISDRCNAGIHALALAAAEEGGKTTVAIAAERLGVSRSYLAKVLQVLARRGLVETTKGAAGGYILAKEASRLSCLDVLEALDGSLPDRQCLFERPVCGSKACVLMSLCRKVSDITRQTLASTSLAAVAAAFK